MSTEKIAMIEKKKKLIIELEKSSKDLKGKENVLSYALDEVLSRIDMWFFHYLDTEDKIKCGLPLEYFNEQILMLEQYSAS